MLDIREIEDMVDLAEESEDLWGMTYREGVIEALNWVLERTGEPPFEKRKEEE